MARLRCAFGWHRWRYETRWLNGVLPVSVRSCKQTGCTRSEWSPYG